MAVSGALSAVREIGGEEPYLLSRRRVRKVESIVDGVRSVSRANERVPSNSAEPTRPTVGHERARRPETTVRLRRSGRRLVLTREQEGCCRGDGLIGAGRFRSRRSDARKRWRRSAPQRRRYLTLALTGRFREGDVSPRTGYSLRHRPNQSGRRRPTGEDDGRGDPGR